MVTSRRSQPSRPLRSSRLKVQTYHEESSSDDSPDDHGDSDSEEGELRRLSLSLRPRSSNRIPGSYREDSTDDDLEGTGSDEPEVIAEGPDPSTQPLPGPTSSNGAASRPRRNRTVKTRPQTKRSRNNSRLELGRPRSKRKKVEVDETPFFGSGVIPPWQHLPYSILFDIFFYASRPLIDKKTSTRTASVQWLVQMALLCRGFHEPALAALYYSPPLLPAAKCHGLVHLLSQPQESLSTNYTNKIKELHVDVETLLLYKSGPTLGYFDLSSLIERTPRVKKIRLYHAQDYAVGILPWERRRSKWTYQERIFESIAVSSLRLRSWDWNGLFMEMPHLVPYAMTKHLQPAFQDLEELRVLHVAAEEFESSDDEEGFSNPWELALATALKELPKLHRLVFFECGILNDISLPNLPTTLTSLTVNNCDALLTDAVGPFLASHGQHLRELDLSHNRHVGLSFIVGLAESCKRLEKFKMDFSMNDWCRQRDISPHYPYLLHSSEVPTWPATLQDLELIQLQKWDDAAAETLFTSLINAAPQLPNLRRLVISAILEIGWRDRATFREKWISRLEHVFLRRDAPPNPSLRTLRRSPPAEPGTAEDTITSAPHSEPNSGPSTPSKRKSARLAQRKLVELEDDQSTEGSPLSSRAAAEAISEGQPRAVQGMCDVVMVRIDNQRPTETQFSEGDFLDEEVSGDEDWNGNDWDVAEGGYAW